MSSSHSLSSPEFGRPSISRLSSPSAAPSDGLSIGYLVAHAAYPLEAGAAALREAGCGAVRIERSSSGAVLARLLDFLTPDDLLVLPGVRGLPDDYGGLERLLDELDERGLTAVFLAEGLRTDGDDGRLLRRAVAAAAELRRSVPRRPSAEIHAEALAMREAGAGPTEIARALRVSRMTVWRWLKAAA